MFGSADCVHVVTINTHMLNAAGTAPEGARALDAKILELPKQFKNVDVVQVGPDDLPERRRTSSRRRPHDGHGAPERRPARRSW